MIPVTATVNEPDAWTYSMSGFVTEWLGDSTAPSNESEVGDASPTDETYCPLWTAEEASHLVTEDHHADTTTG